MPIDRTTGHRRTAATGGARRRPGAALSSRRRRTGAVGVVASCLLATGLLAPPAGASVSVQQRQELMGKGTAAGDDFGYSMAMTSSTLVIGAKGYQGHGAAFVYRLVAGRWTQSAVLTAADGAAGDDFGQAVAISGSTIMVGAQGAVGARGAVYWYDRSGSRWVQSGQYRNPMASSYGQLGWSVTIDGTVAAAGAPNVPEGQVVTFALSSGKWAKTANFVATDTAAGDSFGWNLQLTSPTALVVTAPGHLSEGVAYVFHHVGSSWHQVQEFKASDTAANDGFGVGELSVSGSTLLIGAPYHATAAGRLYVFTSGAHGWVQSAELKGTNTVAGDHFGLGCAVAGSTIVTSGDRHGAGGEAYVFTDVHGHWTQGAAFTGSHTVSGDGFGRYVSLVGSTAVVAATVHDAGTGEAYVEHV